MRNRVKDHNSDDEQEKEIKEENNQQIVGKNMTQEELERERIKDLPVIADSEISPAAYIFQN